MLKQEDECVIMTVENKPTKKERDPNEPKRPKTGYMYFMQRKRRESDAGQTWKTLGQQEKQVYESMAARDKRRYELECRAYELSKKLKLLIG
jgi:hypothetical protein